MPFTRFDEAAGYLDTLLGDVRLVGIDGWPRSGKTTLARQLVSMRGAGSVLDLDAFVAPGNDEYIQALQVESLAAAIWRATIPTILSGVCLLDAFDRIGVKPDLHVYLKRMSAGMWADEGDAIGVDLTKYETASIEVLPVYWEIHHYHSKSRPHERADIVVEIEDGAEVD